jgi:uncharacterized protein
MTFSLYEAIVPNFQQTLGAVSGLLDKAEAFCAETGLAPTDLVGAKLADDMLPFGYQVKSVTTHSIKGIEGAKAGVFSPDMTPWPADLAGLKAQLAETIAAVNAVTPDEINSLVGREAAFVFGERRMPFAAENFLLSFTLPNFYFHATAAYAIMRAKGVNIGKLDFIGRPRIKM